MSINLEHTLDDNQSINRNFDTLRQAVIDTGGLAVGTRFGVSTVVWPGGSPDTSLRTVTHGLGIIPKLVLLTCSTIAASIAYTNITSTTFQAAARTTDGSSPPLNTTNDFMWLVIG